MRFAWLLTLTITTHIADAGLATQIGHQSPASCFFKVAMVCSSLKPLRFIFLSSR
jgi:hypothetical protein